MENMSALYAALDDDYYDLDGIFAEEVQLQEALEDSLCMPTTGEASSSPISCEICIENKESHEMFQIEGCYHWFCSDCISGHVKSKLEDSIIDIGCLSNECVNVLELDSVRFIIPSDVADRWEKQLSESSILPSQKYYCPFANCTELLVDDEEGEVITESECPHCHRLFCAQCKVPWHQGFSCQQFERDARSEDAFRLLAEQNKWRSCPQCRSVVDKIDGCVHITCRCKYEFCYICGKVWDATHFGTCREEE